MDSPGCGVGERLTSLSVCEATLPGPVKPYDVLDVIAVVHQDQGATDHDVARADRRGVTLGVLTGAVVAAGCHLCGPAVAATVGGISSGALALLGWVLRPLYPVLPLLASARPADRPEGAG